MKAHDDLSSLTIPIRRNFGQGHLLIDGAWRPAGSGATVPVIDPTTEECIAEVASANAADADDAVQAAARAFASGPWSRMHHEERAKIMFRIADLLDERVEDFALRESMNMGIPYRDFVHVIMPHCSGLFRFFGGLAMSALSGGYRDSYESTVKVVTRREPLGVVAAITPFNFPFTLTVSKLAPALAAGNTFVHKPASDTPLTALALGQLLIDAGLPNGVYNLVTGSGGVLGDALVKHPAVDKIAFTGSTKVGQQILRNSADTLKHTTMELGGKAPNIVFADANLDAAVEAAFWAIFWNKGEVCVAGSRLFVQRPIYDDLLDRLVEKSRSAKLGDPLEPDTVIGPIVNRSEYEKILGYIEDGKESGARLATGGGSWKLHGKGYFIQPTIFSHATNDLRISREEIFGPVLPVIPFETEEDAIRLANDTPYGLASGIQTRDLGRALRVAEKIRAGTVWLNTWHKYHPNAPFGGYKMSGFGREQGAEALESYTQVKTIWANLT